MMDGKLGNLAKEIAEDTAKDMNIDMTDTDSVNDVFQKLFKQPTKLMSLIKNVGSKLDEKMKSGDIKESELLEEANNLMQKMKAMPGMGNMKEMFAKMGMPGNMNMSGKMNMGATEANLKRNMRGAQQRDRMRDKLARRQEAREQEGLNNAQLRTTECKDGIENKVFTTGETYEKSAKRTETGNKKKRRKKKK
jgi:NADP-dependent 3-hydroxy acid dehydrogenase YdfG